MKLYLSSFQMGDRFDELAASLVRDARIAVVHNALDYIDPTVRAQYRGFSAIQFLRNYGFDAYDLDLRQFFNDSERLVTELADVQMVWAVGGNAFLLRRAFSYSRLDKLIALRLEEDTLVYGGWSAGACVAGSTLRGIDLMDEPDLTPDDYQPEVIWSGMQLVDLVIVPHFESNHPEASTAAKAVAWLTDAGLPFHALRDGEVLVR